MTDGVTVGAIVAVTRDGVIGADGGLPWHYSEDLKRFKRLTLDATVIMGRRTFESIHCKPLPRRRNIVITRADFPQVECFTEVESAIGACQGAVWVIGGAMLYAAALKYCAFIDMTLVPDNIHRTDAVTFPSLDPAVWRLVSETVMTEDPRLILRRYENEANS